MAYSDTCALLMAARMLITDPEAWTKFSSARDIAGDPVCSWGGKAVKWCMEGAVLAHAQDFLPTWSVLQTATGCLFPHEFNDTHTHKEVLAALDKAIEAST